MGLWWAPLFKCANPLQSTDFLPYSNFKSVNFLASFGSNCNQLIPPYFDCTNVQFFGGAFGSTLQSTDSPYFDCANYVHFILSFGSICNQLIFPTVIAQVCKFFWRFGSILLVFQRGHRCKPSLKGKSFLFHNSFNSGPKFLDVVSLPTSVILSICVVSWIGCMQLWQSVCVNFFCYKTTADKLASVVKRVMC